MADQITPTPFQTSVMNVPMDVSIFAGGGRGREIGRAHV